MTKRARAGAWTFTTIPLRPWLMVALAACAAVGAACCGHTSGLERWQKYRDRIAAEPGLVRLYTFEAVPDSRSTTMLYWLRGRFCSAISYDDQKPSFRPSSPPMREFDPVAAERRQRREKQAQKAG